MSRKRFSAEQIIGHLREAEVRLAQGQTVGEICRQIGISEQSYYRWRREYGGLKLDQARRLKDLERENGRLRRAVADLTEQIIGHLREAEVRLAQGQTVGEICRQIGISEQSYYRWRREYGGLKLDQARRLKDLERENGRLRRAVADLTVEKLVLKEAAEGNW